MLWLLFANRPRMRLFGRGVRLEEVGAEGVPRSVCRKALVETQG
jgi:hypothetical protein